MVLENYGIVCMHCISLKTVVVLLDTMEIMIG